VLSIGIVVDDAIVVVENVERHLAPARAARGGARRDAGGVRADHRRSRWCWRRCSCQLAFMGGVTGQFYRSSR
jgi:gold/copper resistance efflux pump